jgi:hypothetical protein
LPARPADADALRVVAAVAEGLVPPVPIHLLPPSWRSFCSSRRFLSVSISSSQPIFSMAAFSSGLSSFSSTFLQPVQRNLLAEVGQHSTPLK